MEGQFAQLSNEDPKHARERLGGRIVFKAQLVEDRFGYLAPEPGQHVDADRWSMEPVKSHVLVYLLHPNLQSHLGATVFVQNKRIAPVAAGVDHNDCVVAGKESELLWGRRHQE